jgi:NADPH:quinone reductase-like Zn-dependent oxidoreductase
MTLMHAAVVTSFDEPPHYLEFELPSVRGDHQVELSVLAVGLHPRVRTDATGKHYSGTGVLPMIPGIDGVGQLNDGRRVYFVADDELPGSMAERTIVDDPPNGRTPGRSGRQSNRRGDEPGDVLVGGASPPGTDRTRAERAGARRHR